jgi:predicted alpha/beta superfamily hydrolase
VTDWTEYPADAAELRRFEGRLKVLRDLESPQLGNRRDILALLPASHDGATRRYPVVYMHDGQNLFDPATSFARQWDAGGAADAAADAGAEAILVGIPNAGDERIGEYSPFTDARIGGGMGDAYLDFIAETVKPLVDSTFRTQTGRESTFTAGSSMGGLIGLWGFFGRKDLFGGVAAMSPALWFARRAIFARLATIEPPDGRIYIDGGTAEGPMLLADVARLRDLLIDKGYRAGRDFRFVMDRDGRHDEESWGRRLPAALQFLLGAAGPLRRARMSGS